MSMILEFKKNPEDFLKQYIVVVPMQEPEEKVPQAPKRFYMKKAGNGNVVSLNFKAVGGNDENSLLAYWLPWKNGKALTLALDSAADFMFTTELTNCRFSVLTKDMKKPLVGHVAGTGSATNRDTYEEQAGFPKPSSDDYKLMRRFSKSESQLHGYSGQQLKNPSSAFVFGQRKAEIWSFYAQVAKGILSGDGIKKLGVDDSLECLSGTQTANGLYTIC